MPNPVIPQNITVHLGPPGAAAQNVTVPFPDYIKNVASSEIYPTWPESALRANIYAQITFALSRIYNEFYKSQGYDFDITNSTASDQSFIPGRDIFENIGQIVDQIFNSYVRREGSVEPLFTQYCNGTTVTCDGLSQWGTVPLAESGLTPYEILQNYYGDDIELVRDVPVEDVEPSAPEIPLRLGSGGNDVRTVQLRLNRISENYPLIPKIPQTDGLFDQSSENAVREFQRTFSLTDDGVVGSATWYRILFIFNAVKGLSELISEGLTLSEVSKQYPEQLSEGMTGDGVRIVQYYLSFIGEYDDAIPKNPVSGYYGDETVLAVRAFQSQYGLPVTGIIDKDTFNRLFTAYRGLIAELPPEAYPGNARPFGGQALLLGSTGEAVRELQNYLIRIAGDFPEVPLITADGVFGPSTDAAVRAFQQFYGLSVNGVVGPATWDAIADLYDSLTANVPNSSSQFPGYEIS